MSRGGPENAVSPSPRARSTMLSEQDLFLSQSLPTMGCTAGRGLGGCQGKQQDDRDLHDSEHGLARRPPPTRAPARGRPRAAAQRAIPPPPTCPENAQEPAPRALARRSALGSTGPKSGNEWLPRQEHVQALFPGERKSGAAHACHCFIPSATFLAASPALSAMVLAVS